MGRRYYCEYCDRAFTDVVDSRKKHLKGVTHERLKKVYYCKVRDLKTLVEEEKQKEVCRRFRSTGSCPFEEACTFTHYTPIELKTFELEIEEQERRKTVLPSLHDWFEKRAMNSSVKTLDAITLYGSNNPLNCYSFQSLPPSLKPISFEEMRNTEFAKWG